MNMLGEFKQRAAGINTDCAGEVKACIIDGSIGSLFGGGHCRDIEISAHAKVNASAAKASVIPATMMMVSVGTMKIPRVPSARKIRHLEPFGVDLNQA